MDEAKRDVRTIFGEVLDQETPEDLAHYLDAVCGGDADLRRRVERLLRAHRDARGFLGGAHPGGASEDVRAITEDVGTRIGPYKLLELIGEGGFGDSLHGRAAGAGSPQGGPEDHQAGHGHPAGDRAV